MTALEEPVRGEIGWLIYYSAYRIEEEKNIYPKIYPLRIPNYPT